MNRFLKSRNLDGAQRQTIAETLENLQIGDAEGRRIFVLALDYELTEYANYIDRFPPTAPDDDIEAQSELAQLAPLLRTVSLHVRDLSLETRTSLFDRLKVDDDYHRSYDNDYLEAFLAELERLQVACDGTRTQPQRLKEAAHDRPEGRFVVMLAKAYAECFEVSPDAQSWGPFASLLVAIGEQIGLNLDFDLGSLRKLIAAED